MRSLSRILCLVLWVCVAGTRGKLNYTIERTWNGESIAPSEPVTLNISSTKSGDLKLEISAPYFGDPAPDAPSGQHFNAIWKYEVVEVYFLNDDGQYLQVQIGPHGHHTVLLLNGERNYIRHSLPLEPSTTINGDKWNGSVIIPRSYLPANVTKFNAYAIHGTGENRTFWSLYPTNGSTTKPDFHNLNFFKPIDFNTIDPTLSSTTMSNIWNAAITKGKLNYTIERTWNGESIAPSEPVTLNISSTKSGDLKLEIDAPYFGDPAPDAPSGQHFNAIWKYEVVEVYFLNDDGQYLQVQIGPHGHHTVLLLNGERNYIRHSLPLEPSTTINGDKWNGSVIIPRSYLPANVTKFNAYAIHGTGENRTFWSLYPTNGSTTKPDFHNLNFFKPIDFNTIDPTLSSTTMSNIWNAAITMGKLNYTIERTWNGESIAPSEPVTLNISSTKSGDLKLEIDAPYFGDPAPDAPSGQHFNAIWKYEVVEVYFLNDDGQYLQVQIGPHGHHTVLLLNGERNYIRHSLPLEPSTTINGDKWNGSVIIPRSYLPANVTKFNAYAIHGTGKNRTFWSLYPTNGSTTKPDFHNLNFFKPIDFNTIDPTLSSTTMSNIWNAAITKGKLNYTIERTWNGESIAPSEPVTLNISSTKSGDLKLEIDAPYFGDPAPDAPSGQHFNAIWKYEVVEVYFLNDDGQYLQVQIGPHGHHTVLLLNGERNYIRHSLPLEPSTTINGDKWNGSVIIPRSYLPANVTKFNAYAIHGTGKNRTFWSLYPTNGSTTKPDFHNLNFFKPIDFNTIDPTLSSTTMSNIWNAAITKGKLNYTIERTWNGESIAPSEPVTLNISSTKSGDLKLEIDAPYFGDPAPDAPSGQHFNAIWKYEVVEVYFLNDDGQYLQVQIGPHGHHTVLLLNGERNYIRHSLPLEPSTTINGDKWNGSVIIPRSYLPANVTKFNAYAIHGTGKNRTFWSLYPTNGSTTKPDFHNLNFFKPIDFNTIDPTLSSTTMSNIWNAAITKGKLNYTIERTWNGESIAPSEPVTLNISSTKSGDLKLEIDAPYFGDPAPDAPSGQHFNAIWKYEVVEVYFLNDDGQYLQVQIGPHGHHTVLLLNGERNYIRHSLPLEPSTTINGDKWNGSVIIPRSYLPANVTKFNAYAIHGTGKNRTFWSLYPTNGSTTKPDFHNLNFFKPIDFNTIDPTLSSTTMSNIWNAAITKGKLNYTIERTWNGESIAPSEPVTLNISSTKSGDLKLEIDAPYFGDPAPDAPSGQHFNAIWKYEVVEVYFLNDDGQYLQVQIGPHGHHTVLLLNGERNYIRHSLPLEPSTTINGDKWNGSVIIPRSYLPANVTKFNAYAIHGTGKNRTFWSLYPTNGSTTKPDFHNLNFFKPIDFNTIDPTLSSTTMSNIWNAAITKGKLNYTIERTWNGESIAPSEPVTLNISSTKSGDLKLEIDAPYFGDPAPDAPSGQHFNAIWKYEVVEVYFLNDDGQYLQVQIGPHGHHTVLLLNGERNYIRHSLPLEPSTTINGDKWNGSVIIPRSYLPANVTKFNAYAIHGTGKNRTFWSLYPTNGSTTKPDFHNLNFFKPIDFNTIDPTLSSTTMSNIWNAAITKGKLNYTIERTWNGESIAPSEPVTLNISSTKSGDLKLEIDAPYFGDPAPDAPSGQHFNAIWKYEVVEVYFLNDDGQYLQVQIGPHGHHTVLLLNGERNYIRHSLLLEPSTTINGDKWNGSVIIPRSYLPANVTKFNAYAIHGTGENRTFWSLYPTNGSTTKPNFHNLNFFKPIDFNTIDPTLSSTTMSNIWNAAITKGKLNYTIERTWNGESIAPSEPVTLNISSTKSGDLKLEISAPYFGDPAPDAPSGQSVIALWDYEVVAAFFLNDDDQYLEVDIGPHGHHMVVLFNGTRNRVHHSLSLELSSTIDGGIWNGTVIIPKKYLPPKVSKFNAHAAHGSIDNRQYWSIYSTDNSTTKADFHKLELFKPIDLSAIDPELVTSTFSSLWNSIITE